MNGDIQFYVQDLAYMATDDSKDIASIYKFHAAGISNGLRKQFGDGPPDPDEMVQQAFEKLAEKDNLSNIKNIKAFLWRTAFNLTLNQKRNQNIRSSYDYELEHIYSNQTGDKLAPERVIEIREQLSIINQALMQMPNKRRDCFIMNRIEGLTINQIAEHYGVTRTAIVKHIARAAAEIDSALEIE